MEIFLTLLIVTLTIYIIAKKFVKMKKGQCDCSMCTDKCPKYEDKINLIKK